jgi:beta-mannosidase
MSIILILLLTLDLKYRVQFWFRFNDREYAWVGRANWTYTARFTLEPSFLTRTSIELDLHGVDTVAAITLNDRLIASTENMFVRYIFPVKDALLAGDNRLVIEFQSPVGYAARAFERQSRERHTVPPACVAPEFRGVCHANHIRKMQSSFSWDWGPAAPSVGLWQPAQLIGYDDARFKYVLWEITNSDETADEIVLRITVVLQAASTEPVPLTLDYQIVGPMAGPESISSVLTPNSEGEIEWSVGFSVAKNRVDWWWPNGHGEQVLYDVELALKIFDMSTGRGGHF